MNNTPFKEIGKILKELIQEEKNPPKKPPKKKVFDKKSSNLQDHILKRGKNARS